MGKHLTCRLHSRPCCTAARRRLSVRQTRAHLRCKVAPNYSGPLIIRTVLCGMQPSAFDLVHDHLRCRLASGESVLLLTAVILCDDSSALNSLPTPLPTKVSRLVNYPGTSLKLSFRRSLRHHTCTSFLALPGYMYRIQLDIIIINIPTYSSISVVCSHLPGCCSSSRV